MNIAFYIDEMNLRGVANQTFLLAVNNKTILKNNSIIFYNQKNHRNNKEVIKKFKKKFITVGVSKFKDIDKFKKKYQLEFLYTQKGGNIDSWQSQNIKTLIHAVYPQKLNQIHGYNYAYASDWLSEKFSNKKIPVVSYMVYTHQTKNNLKKKLKIDKSKIVLGCHGGESSFDLKFAHDAIKDTVAIRKDIVFIFLNINKFINHPRIKFLKGTSNESFKKMFVNTCDGMIYGRSLGESFGLACAEFAVQDKPIISYEYNRHKNHKFCTPKTNFIEYGSYSSLIKILTNFRRGKNTKLHNKYKKLKPKKIMEDFKNNFLKNKNEIKIDFFDYFINFYSFLKMNLNYLRHKIYHHYYTFIKKIFY